MKKIILISGAALLAVAATAYFVVAPATPPGPEGTTAGAASSDVISRNGIHWHANVAVYQQGVRREVPGNIGIGPAYSQAPNFEPRMGMAGMHTHNPDGTIHLELPGVVRREDVTLGAFFRTWGKSFEDFGSKLVIKVNGADVSDADSYEMKDGDQITLSFFP